MKICPISYVIRVMLIKTTMRYHYISSKMAKIQNTNNTKSWRGCGATGTLIHCWWKWKIVQPLWKTVVSYITKYTFTIQSSNCTLWNLPKELKTYVHAKTCTRMIIAALFIIAKTWKQPRCFSVGEWINKLWYSQTMEYYSALKRNELSNHEKT